MNLRLDRLLTLYLVSPVLRMTPRKSRFIPILMYHSITDQGESGRHEYYRTNTAPEVFADQMMWLRSEGYTACSLQFALDRFQQRSDIDEKHVVITFDDGYADFYTHAFPALQECGFTGSVFLPTAYIGNCATTFKGKECLTWNRVRELRRHGISFGSHTVTHPRLVEMNVSQIDNEIVASKKTIEDQLSEPVHSFAYPYAFPQTDGPFKNMLRERLLSAGYTHGVCTTIGRANSESEPLFLERLPINSCDDEALLRAKLNGAYDWIGTTQRFSKMVRAYLPSPTNAPKSKAQKEISVVQRPS